MADPITLGALVASALAMGAEAALKGAIGEAVKDAYKALKGAVSRWATTDVEALEQTPASLNRQGVVAEAVDAQSDLDRETVRVLAQKLVAALEHHAAVMPDIGIDVGRLRAVEVDLGKITVQHGIGVRIGEVETDIFKTDTISVGGDLSGKK